MSTRAECAEVACSTDERYVPHLATMLWSLLLDGGLQLRIHLVHGPELSSGSIRRLAEMVARGGGMLNPVAVAPASSAGGMAALSSHWYRLLLPDLLPELDRVLYLDSDLLVLDSLAELWTTALDGYYLAATTNVFKLEDLARQEVRSVGDPGSYFNSGVMLLNLDAMRRDRCVERLLRYAGQHRRTDWFEQDALNVVLGERRRALAPRWNCMNSMFLFPWAPHVFGVEPLEEALRNPAVRHFEGPSVNKPWHYLCERPMYERYREYRRQTPWSQWTPEGRSSRNRLTKLSRRTREHAGSAVRHARSALRRSARSALRRAVQSARS